MATRCGLFALVFFVAHQLYIESRTHLIVWNVGQGQWVTIVTTEACWHFDVGGEFASWSKIAQVCRQKPNRVSLSHWDWDHLGLLHRAQRSLPQICLVNHPLGPASAHKQEWLSRFPLCALSTLPFAYWENAQAKTVNGRSRVVAWQGMLAPGDSTRHEEKIWIHSLKEAQHTRFLILGHHGSRGSTSPALVATLSHLQTAIASSRFRRYGHPHRDVENLLQKAHVPLLKTEDWGNLHFDL